MKNKKIHAVSVALIAAASAVFVFLTGVLLPRAPVPVARAAYRFVNYEGKPPIHIYRSAQKSSSGVTPAQIKKAYGLPATGGTGTIAIIDAYDDPSIESDLAVFDKQYGLPACTVKNGCLEKHMMSATTTKNGGWAVEISLDVEWAHAIAPNAKILLVEAKTQSGANLLAAVDYATGRKDVTAVSMSWGGEEFSDQLSYDAHLMPKANPGTIFFAASGDDGTGVSWPASSPNVIGVGGTSLTFSSKGALVSETAWSGSGGGVSAYEKQPAYQKAYSIPKAGGMRAIPDVAYDADPSSGFSVYYSGGKTSGTVNGWYVVGGTSAGAPQWAAIRALGTVTLAKLYADKAASSTLSYFRDITSGSNGTCKYYCAARARYDYVTGLGSPQTVKF
ncbi:MAG: S53 family peptidase [Candidatus Pacebacteria bacterium]|nr:S53 family peptidase [Candidatus Paceibacterota bacterium]